MSDFVAFEYGDICAPAAQRVSGRDPHGAAAHDRDSHALTPDFGGYSGKEIVAENAADGVFGVAALEQKADDLGQNPPAVSTARAAADSRSDTSDRDLRGRPFLHVRVVDYEVQSERHVLRADELGNVVDMPNDVLAVGKTGGVEHEPDSVDSDDAARLCQRQDLLVGDIAGSWSTSARATEWEKISTACSRASAASNVVRRPGVRAVDEHSDTIHFHKSALSRSGSGCRCWYARDSRRPRGYADCRPAARVARPSRSRPGPFPDALETDSFLESDIRGRAGFVSFGCPDVVEVVLAKT